MSKVLYFFDTLQPHVDRIDRFVARVDGLHQYRQILQTCRSRNPVASIHPALNRRYEHAHDMRWAQRSPEEPRHD